MPFTVSHAVVALPAGRLPLMASAVAAGSMAPDALYFLPIQVNANFSHTFLGAITFDALLAALMTGIWWVMLAQAFRAWAPRTIRSAIPPVERSTRPLLICLLLAYISAALGALTHVLWDAFTHIGRWGTQLIPALSDGVFLGLPGYRVAQYASSLLGLVILIWWFVAYLRRNRCRFDPGPDSTRWFAVTVSCAIAAGLIACGLRMRTLTIQIDSVRSLFDLGFPVLTAAGGAVVFVVAISALLFRLREPRPARS